MPSEDHLSDDYIAALLTKDARESTSKYSALGLQALLPKRPITNAPRANTRFLKNIIRDTDSHNATLKVKEAEEAKARLRRLRGADSTLPRSSGRERPYVYGQQDNNELSQKRRRISDDEDRKEQRQQRHEERASRYVKNNEECYKNSRRHRDDVTGAEGRYRIRSHRLRKSCREHHARSRSRSRSRSKERISRQNENRRAKSRARSCSPTNAEGHEYHELRRRKDHRSDISPEREKTPHRRLPKSRQTETDATDTRNPQDQDSDPLESIIGPPLPPLAPRIRPRGRGNFASSSAMDSHFSSGYDPSADIQPNSDSENDWDQALEVLKDRERWKQQGAERLRSAGFTEDEVSKWENRGEKREEDVRWKGRGEGREWDWGKVVDGEGMVDTRPEWGRLKGT